MSFTPARDSPPKPVSLLSSYSFATSSASFLHSRDDTTMIEFRQLLRRISTCDFVPKTCHLYSSTTKTEWIGGCPTPVSSRPPVLSYFPSSSLATSENECTEDVVVDAGIELNCCLLLSRLAAVTKMFWKGTRKRKQHTIRDHYCEN